MNQFVPSAKGFKEKAKEFYEKAKAIDVKMCGDTNDDVKVKLAIKAFQDTADKFVNEAKGYSNGGAAHYFHQFAEKLKDVLRSDTDLKKLKRWNKLLNMKKLKALKKATQKFLGAVIGFKGAAETFVEKSRAFKNECTDAKLLDKFQKAAESLKRAGEAFGGATGSVASEFQKFAKELQKVVEDNNLTKLVTKFQAAAGNDGGFLYYANKFDEEASKIDSSDKGICTTLIKCIEKVFGRDCICTCSQTIGQCSTGLSSQCQCTSECKCAKEVCLKCCVVKAACHICCKINSACGNLKGGVNQACQKICDWINHAQGQISGLLKCPKEECPACSDPKNCCEGNAECKCDTDKPLTCAVVLAAKAICNHITQATKDLKQGVATACTAITGWIGSAEGKISDLLICPKEEKGKCKCHPHGGDNCGTSGASCKEKSSLQCKIVQVAQAICNGITSAANNLKTGLNTVGNKICTWIDKAHNEIEKLFTCTDCDVCRQDALDCCNGAGKTCICTDSKCPCLKCVVIKTSQEICTKIKEAEQALEKEIKDRSESITIICSIKGSNSTIIGNITKAMRNLKEVVQGTCRGICQCLNNIKQVLDKLLKCDNCKCPQMGGTSCTEAGKSCSSDTCLKKSVIDATNQVCDAIGQAETALKGGIGTGLGYICTWTGTTQEAIKNLLKCNDGCSCPSGDNCGTSGASCKEKSSLQCKIVEAAKEICDKIGEATKDLKQGVATACEKICEWIGKAQEGISGLFKCPKGESNGCQACRTPNEVCSKGDKCLTTCTDPKSLTCLVVQVMYRICKAIDTATNTLTTGVQTACQTICECLKKVCETLTQCIEKVFGQNCFKYNFLTFTIF